MTIHHPYFPFDISALENFGFSPETVVTGVGRLRVYRRRDFDRDSRSHRVFLHGAGLSSRSWTPLVGAGHAALPPGEVGNWVFIDLPGFGGSEVSSNNLTINGAAEAVVDVAHGFGIEEFDLVGHSMGGFLALHVASCDVSGAVRSVTSIGGTYASIVEAVNHPMAAVRRVPRSTLTFLAMSTLARSGGLGSLALHLGANSGVMRLFLPGIAAHPSQVRRSFIQSVASENRPEALRAAERTGLGYDYAKRWRRIEAATLVIQGASDSLVTRSDVELFASLVPHAVVKVIDQAAHLVPQEQPTAVLQELLGWWSDVE